MSIDYQWFKLPLIYPKGTIEGGLIHILEKICNYVLA